MEIKNTTTKFTYKIEERPGGGYVARPGEPGMEVIEGETREEVMKKLEDKMTSMLGTNLHGMFKLGGMKVDVKRNVKLTGNISGSSSADASEPNALPQGEFSAVPTDSGDRTGTILRALAALAAIGALLYYLLHR